VLEVETEVSGCYQNIGVNIPIEIGRSMPLNFKTRKAIKNLSSPSKLSAQSVSRDRKFSVFFSRMQLMAKLCFQIRQHLKKQREVTTEKDPLIRVLTINSNLSFQNITKQEKLFLLKHGDNF
jgi:hypothetical protein